jgi:hypothetical protein
VSAISGTVPPVKRDEEAVESEPVVVFAVPMLSGSRRPERWHLLSILVIGRRGVPQISLNTYKYVISGLQYGPWRPFE